MSERRRSSQVQSFKARWVHNLGPNPIYIQNSADHRVAMREANAFEIGDDGMKDLREKVNDRNADIARRKKQDDKNK